MKTLGTKKKGLAFVISAPAGTGKTTLVRMLMKECPCVTESVSFTTRKPRPNEIEGRDYFFVSRSEFEQKIEEGEFLEYAEVFGQFYGTSKQMVLEQQAQGKHVVLVIDTQGALQLMGQIEAVFIFICPPSLEELKKRLTGRKSESPEMIGMRLSWAQKEISLADRYDYQIVNDDLETAYEVLKAIFVAEEHKIR